ncbi:leucine-rich PPR motif-containing protein, mitochondrial [Diprion similis]|uniref:leucine-rich PPR motif-containing protein, mitochondrial n=1 Tax=Diprion similis TaxID=362088 RepID=UPI001EF8FED3|nr:leucine-rich PPR motif-containing protein, mitochondrial [Diprion similis]
MATILRSSKYFRNFAELITKLSLSQVKHDACVTLISQRHCIAPSTLAKSLVTQVAVRQVEGDFSLDSSLQDAESDVEKYGRISERKFHRMFKTFQSSTSITSTQALMVLRFCGQLVDNELPEIKSEIANQIWERLKNSGTELKVSHYNALLCAYIENEYAFSPAEVLAEMDKAGIEPNKLTYQRIITGYCQQGDIEGASTILEYMKEKNLSINENIFTALIRGHSEAGDMKSAAEILSIMRTTGSEPSADAYKELLCGYAKHGDMESITRTIAECKLKHIDLLSTDYLDVIDSLVRNGHTQHVEAVLSVTPKEVGYLHEAFDHIYKLVHSGHAEAAMQVLRSIPIIERHKISSARVKNLVKADLPTTQLVNMCKEIENKGIYSGALYIGLEHKLLQKDVEGSLVFLNILRDSGEEIRPHYFWPLFIALKFSDKDILNLVETIQKLSVIITPETLRDYIVPCMNGTPDEIFNKLIVTGVLPATIAYAIVYSFIKDARLKEVADFCTKHEFSYNVEVLCKPLVQALKATEDTESFVRILSNMCESTMKTMDDDAQKKTVYSDIIGLYLSEVSFSIKKDKPNLQAQIYSELSKAGLGIDNTGPLSVSQKLDSQSPSKIDGNRFMSRHKYKHQDVHSEIKHLERSLVSLNKSNRRPVKLRHLLFLYSRVGDIANVEKVVKELKECAYYFSERMNMALVSAYCQAEMLDKTEQYISALKAAHPSHVLDPMVTIKYITLLVKANRVNDAVQYIENMPNTDTKNHAEFKSLCWKVLLSVAELGNVEAVNAIFDKLVQKEYIQNTPSYLGILIKVHIYRNDLKGALKTFEKICETYRLTPCHSELSKKFILAEDATSLQRLTDLSTQIHGEANSLYELALNFIQCDCLRQAKRILEIPALFPKVQKLKLQSQKYRELGKTQVLEKLISVLKDIPHLKAVPEFYDDLIQCYDKENAWNAGFKLWQQITEQEIEPSDRFLAILADLLKRNNQPVPFEVPVSQYSEKSPTEQNAKRQSVNITSDGSAYSNSEMNITMPHYNNSSVPIHSLLDQRKINEAYELTCSFVEENQHPTPRVIYRLITAMIETGNHHLIMQLRKRINGIMKFRLKFDHKLCAAYTESGKLDKLLDLLEESLETIVQRNGEPLINSYPKVLAKDLLNNNPEFLERYIKLTEKYADHGIFLPIEILWTELFVKQIPEADRIWTQYLSDKPNGPLTSLITYTNVTKNSKVVEKIAEILKNNPHVTPDVKAWIYSSLISAYCMEHKYEESIVVLQKAIADEKAVEFIKPSLLQNLNYNIKAQNLNLPADVSEIIAKAIKKTTEKQQTT